MCDSLNARTESPGLMRLAEDAVHTAKTFWVRPEK